MSLQHLLSKQQRFFKTEKGFAGMSELVMAAGVGSLIVMASGAALQSTGTLIKQSEEKATLRQNSINGLRLMRSEVERSNHLVLEKTESSSPEDKQFDLTDKLYKSVVDECIALANNRPFRPVFGVKMAELNKPVIYGVSLGSGGYSFE